MIIPHTPNAPRTVTGLIGMGEGAAEVPGTRSQTIPHPPEQVLPFGQVIYPPEGHGGGVHTMVHVVVGGCVHNAVL